jgi:GDP-L-fucose synthase
MSFWKDKRVLVTGGAGFIGSHLVEMLVAKRAEVKVADNLENANLNNLKEVKNRITLINVDLKDLKNCIRVTEGVDIVLNLVAKVGGIDFNIRHPASIVRDNMLFILNMIEASRISKVERFLAVSSACVYPRDCKIPTPETEGFVGIPEPTNEGYGWAKRMSEVLARSYHQEFGMKVAIARPYNAYGPRDHFETERSHVIPALIKRVFDRENPLVVWGNGEQSRAFVYVEDLARGLMEIIERYPNADPVNIGTDEEIKIKDLIKMIVEISGIKTQIEFDASKPLGQLRRNCDISKAICKINFKTKYSLREGLIKTINWYKENYKHKGERE